MANAALKKALADYNDADQNYNYLENSSQIAIDVEKKAKAIAEAEVIRIQGLLDACQIAQQKNATEITRLTNELAIANAQIAAGQPQLATAQGADPNNAEIQRLQARIAVLEGQLAAAQAIDQNNAEIVRLNRELLAEKTRIVTVNMQLATAQAADPNDTEVKRLNGELTTANTRATDLQAQLQTAQTADPNNAEIVRLNGEITTSKAQITTLTQERDDCRRKLRAEKATNTSGAGGSGGSGGNGGGGNAGTSRDNELAILEAFSTRRQQALTQLIWQRAIHGFQHGDIDIAHGAATAAVAQARAMRSDPLIANAVYWMAIVEYYADNTMVAHQLFVDCESYQIPPSEDTREDIANWLVQTDIGGSECQKSRDGYRRYLGLETCDGGSEAEDESDDGGLDGGKKKKRSKRSKRKRRKSKNKGKGKAPPSDDEDDDNDYNHPDDQLDYNDPEIRDWLINNPMGWETGMGPRRLAKSDSANIIKLTAELKDCNAKIAALVALLPPGVPVPPPAPSSPAGPIPDTSGYVQRLRTQLQNCLAREAQLKGLQPSGSPAQNAALKVESDRLEKCKSDILALEAALRAAGVAIPALVAPFPVLPPITEGMDAYIAGITAQADACLARRRQLRGIPVPQGTGVPATPEQQTAIAKLRLEHQTLRTTIDGLLGELQIAGVTPPDEASPPPIFGSPRIAQDLHIQTLTARSAFLNARIRELRDLLPRAAATPEQAAETRRLRGLEQTVIAEARGLEDQLRTAGIAFPDRGAPPARIGGTRGSTARGIQNLTNRVDFYQQQVTRLRALLPQAQGKSRKRDDPSDDGGSGGGSGSGDGGSGGEDTDDSGDPNRRRSGLWPVMQNYALQIQRYTTLLANTRAELAEANRRLGGRGDNRDERLRLEGEIRTIRTQLAEARNRWYWGGGFV